MTELIELCGLTVNAGYLYIQSLESVRDPVPENGNDHVLGAEVVRINEIYP